MANEIDLNQAETQRLADSMKGSALDTLKVLEELGSCKWDSAQATIREKYLVRFDLNFGSTTLTLSSGENGYADVKGSVVDWSCRSKPDSSFFKR